MASAAGTHRSSSVSAFTLLGRGGQVTGVVGKKAIHLMDKDEREKVSKIDDLWIDIGATTRAEARGARADGRCRGAGGRTARVAQRPPREPRAWTIASVPSWCSRRCACSRRGGPGAGDRHRGRHDAGGDLATPGGGARTCARPTSRPMVALVVDVTHATDYPGLDKRKHGDYRLGGGPAIGRGASLSHMVLRPADRGRRGGEDPLHDRGGVTRHPHRRRGDLQQPPRRGHGTGVGAAALHAQPERDGTA